MKKFATSSRSLPALGKVKPPETTEGRKKRAKQNRVDTHKNSVRRCARTLTGASQDYDPLIDLVGDARFVLIGEASHGTHDFYHERAQITALN